MFTSLIFATLLLTATSFVTEDKEGFLAVRDDYDNDRNEYLDLWDLTKDVDIWDENTKKVASHPVIPEETLKQLCKNYELAIDDQVIDCKDLKLIQKSFKIDERHILQKRQAEQEVSLDEGSGDGEEHAAEPEKTQQEATTLIPEPQHVATEQIEKLFQYQSANVVDLNAVDAEKGDTSKHVEKNAEIKMTAEHTPPEEKSKEHEVGHDVEHQSYETSTEEKNLSETTSAQNPVEKLAENKPAEEKPANEKPAEEKSAAEKPIEGTPIEEKKSTQEKPIEKELTTETAVSNFTPTEEKPETKKDLPQSVSEQYPGEEQTSKDAKKLEEKPVSEIPVTPETSSIVVSQKTGDVTPSSQATNEESKDSEKEKADKPNQAVDKDSESKVPIESDIKPTSEPKEQEPSRNDNKKGRMFTNQKEDGKETPNIATASMGEAKESVSQKDTKILVGLFGAVIGVGAAAFAYNYIRKKKRANASRTSTNGVSRNDPEEGKEMKPLMKNEGSSKQQSVEYKDERQDKTEEVKS